MTMRIKILTLFPEMFLPVLGRSITGRAIERGILSIEPIDIRAYTKNKHNRCDDYPYGGGAGLVMTPQPIYDCFRAAVQDFPARHILLSPRGKTLTQQRARELAQEENLIFLCGHYEGVDQRAFAFHIEVVGHLVEKEHVALAIKGARHQKQRCLPAGKLLSTLTDERIQPRRQRAQQRCQSNLVGDLRRARSCFR